MKQYKVTIICDEGFVADSLREAAADWENGDMEAPFHSESGHYDATIQEY